MSKDTKFTFVDSKADAPVTLVTEKVANLESLAASVAGLPLPERFVEADPEVIRSVFRDYKDTDGAVWFRNVKVYPTGQKAAIDKLESMSTEERLFASK